MVEFLKVLVSFVLALLLLCGVSFLLFSFPAILLATLVLVLIMLLVYGLTAAIYFILF